MPAVITPLFHHNIARTIYEGIETKRSRYHYFIGKVLPWIDEVNVPEVENSIAYKNDIKNNIVSTKEITLADIAYSARMIPWISDKIFTMYDDINTDLENSDFYTITDQWELYKCIYNNNGGPSTSKPTGQSSSYITLSDGYVWKFMSYIPLSMRNKFFGSGYVPVTTSVSNNYFTAGSIDSYTIMAGGSGYIADETYVEIEGDGTGAEIDLIITSGEIVDVSITTPGTGYTYANVIITSDDATSSASVIANLGVGTIDTAQATVELESVDGSISFVKVESGGSNYINPAVAITGDGVGATAEVVTSGGVISSINVTSYGFGYTYADIVLTDVSSSTGAGAVLRVIITPVGGHGRNLPEELYTNTLCFFGSLEKETNQGIVVDNEYRQFGIVKNINNYNAVTRFNDTNGSSCFLISFAGGILNTVVSDNEIKTLDSSKSFIVVGTTATNDLLISSLLGKSPSVGETYYIGEDEVGTITGIVAPTIDKKSGELLLIDNRPGFSSSSEQSVTIRTFIKF